jgi:hypothetical protein
MDLRMKKRTIVAGIAVFLLLRGLAMAGYADNSDGTVTSTVTNLMWQKQDDATARTWDQALTYCAGLSLGGHADWRLPNIKELKSLADMTRHTLAIDPVFTGTQSSDYWSSTTAVSNATHAWLVHFFNGYLYNADKAVAGYVRCVR